MRRIRPILLALALVGCALAALLASAAPASAVGPSMMLTVAPPESTGTPTATGSGEANFTATVDLFSNPPGRATIAITVESYFGWSVNPPGANIPVTAPGRYTFNFTVEVPPDSVAGTADADLVTVNYRVGGVTTYTDAVTVHTMVGGYYAGAARRVSPPVVMDAGQTYLVAFDIQNQGNARSVFGFSFPDQAILDRLRADILPPDNPTIAGQNNTTVEFKVKPGGTSPAGKYSIPVRVDVRDRHNDIQATFNFTMELEVANLAIYQGFLPNMNLQGPYTLTVFAVLFLSLWFVRHLVLSLVKRDDGVAWGTALRTRLANSHLVRLCRHVVGRARRGSPKPAKKRPLTPAEIKGRAAAARPHRER